MQALYNHGGELIAYHHQNMLLHPYDLEVLGLVLGNCVFDRQARILGKLVHQKIYNLSGEVLARQSDSPGPLPEKFSEDHCVQQAWQILTMIKDHNCPWVTTRDTWSRDSLAGYLYTQAMIY